MQRILRQHVWTNTLPSLRMKMGTMKSLFILRKPLLYELGLHEDPVMPNSSMEFNRSVVLNRSVEFNPSKKLNSSVELNRSAVPNSSVVSNSPVVSNSSMELNSSMEIRNSMVKIKNSMMNRRSRMNGNMMKRSLCTGRGSRDRYNVGGDVANRRPDWLPDEDCFLEHDLIDDRGEVYNLYGLIKKDVNDAREFFINVLYEKYKEEPEMYAKWGVMEREAGCAHRAVEILQQGSKYGYSIRLYTAWALSEIELKQYKKAYRLYEVMLEHDPGNTEVLFGKLMLEKKMEKKQDYSKMFEALHEKEPEDLNILHAWAVHEGKEEQFTKARDLFRTCITYKNATPMIWQAWANMERVGGSLQFGYQLTQVGRYRFPTHWPMMLTQALILQDMGKIQAARKLFQEAVKFPTVQPELFNAYGHMEQKVGNLELAVNIYEDALKKHPAHRQTIVSLALLLFRMKLPNDARAVFEHGCKQTMNAPQLLMEWAEFEMKLKHNARVKELCKEILSEGNLWPRAILMYAEAEHNERNYANARSILRHGLLKLPSNVNIMVQLAKYEQLAKNWDTATNLLDRAISCDKSNSKLWNARILLEMRTSSIRAEELLQEAFTHIPQHKSVSWSVLMATYGKVLSRLKRYDESKEMFEKSIDLQPKNWRTYLQMGTWALMPAGRYEEAIENFEKAKQWVSHTHLFVLEEKIEEARTCQ